MKNLFAKVVPEAAALPALVPQHPTAPEVRCVPNMARLLTTLIKKEIKLIYEEMRKYFPIYEEAVSHI
jgi:hypothetical protein